MGYIVIDCATTFIDKASVIKDGAVIHPFTSIVGSIIENGAIIKSFSSVENSNIGKGAVVFASVIENSVVGEGATIGPFAHLRPESKIRAGARVGNFVEIKNSTIGEKTKVSHLSYVGDADVGENVNIGCGVVFVNYNGKIKQHTSVGKNSFIGSSVNLIAPIKVGESAFVCAGTTLDKDVSSGDFVIGRSKMVVKPQRAKKYLGE